MSGELILENGSWWRTALALVLSLSLIHISLSLPGTRL